MSGIFVGLGEEQVLLADTTERYLESHLPLTAVRDLHDDPAGYPRTWWEGGAELGWCSLLVPEAAGGGSASGHPVVDAALLAERMGRHVQPGPFVVANVAAWLLGRAGRPGALLDDVVAGRQVLTWAPGDEHGVPDGGAGLVAERRGDAVLLRGRRGFVQHVVGADAVLVATVVDGAPAHVLVPIDAPGLRVEALEALDLGRRFAHLHLDGVEVDAEAVVTGGGEAAEGALLRAVALTVAETVGAMDRIFEVTVAYAKDRIAFGRPIGSFQAIKHVLADLALLVESAKAGAAAAARAVDEDPHAGDLVHAVAAHVADAGHEVGQQCLQVHGGIGYTWEHDLHLYLRRIRSNGAAFGTATWHRERLCARHGLGEAVA